MSLSFPLVLSLAGRKDRGCPNGQMFENKAHNGVLALVHYCSTTCKTSKICLILRDVFLLGTALVLRLERKLHRINHAPVASNWRLGCNSNAEREAMAGDPWRQRTVFVNVC